VVRSAATMVGRALVLSVVLSIVVAVRASSPALACSCGGPEAVVANQDEFDAAFVGTLIAAPAVGSSIELPARITFRVEGVYRGELAPTLTVSSDNFSSMCDLAGLAVGARFDVVLQRKSGEWRAGLCSSFPAGSLAGLGPLYPASERARG